MSDQTKSVEEIKSETWDSTTSRMYSNTLENVSILGRGITHNWDYREGIYDDYRITEHVDADGYDPAKSHKIVSTEENRNELIEGDSVGYSWISDAVDPFQSSSDGNFVSIWNKEFKGPYRSFKDIIYAGGGNDYVKGKTGEDELYGESGDDVLEGGSENDILYGGIGNDVVDGGTGADKLYGGKGDDILVADTSDTVIDGGEGYDIAVFNSSIGDTQTISIEEFQFIGDNGDNNLASNDSISKLSGGLGNDTLQGGAANDTLIGGSGLDSLSGGDGDDQIYADDNDVLVDGGAGNDTVFVNGTFNMTNTVNVEYVVGAEGADSIMGNAGNNIIYGKAGNDTISGLDGDDLLQGEAGADTLFGGSGNDTVCGGAGADNMNGGAGIDWVDYSTSSEAVLVNLGLNGGMGGDAEGDALINFENVNGSMFNDTISGGDGDNILDGRDGNDNLIAGSGVDTLLGGAGNDALYGGVGTDYLLGEAGNDIYVFQKGNQMDVVIENDNNGTDLAYIRDFTEVGIYKNGNDLLIAGNNNQDIMQFQNWYSSHSVENFYFEAVNATYTADQIASFAVDITPAA